MRKKYKQKSFILFLFVPRLLLLTNYVQVAECSWPNHKVPGSIPTGGGTELMTIVLYCFSISPFHHLDIITKTCLYNFDPFKPHFYIVKLGFTEVCIIFLISAQNIDCGYSLEPHRRGGSNEYPQSMFWAEIWKISEFFIWKFSFFHGKIFSVFE